MADQVNSGSPERVALELYRDLCNLIVPTGDNVGEFVGRRLALYEQCLRATKQARIDTSGLK